ncbi:MAG: hypothetical protein DWQ37_05380 [Planctomycetota bacterium]|nr:MAG: hypothetical protein DWQ37_05380 [Planctomycetota bacterium]
MTPPEQNANELFVCIVADLEQEADGAITATLLGDKLRHWAWNQAVAGMMKPRTEQVRRPHYAQQPETD